MRPWLLAVFLAAAAVASAFALYSDRAWEDWFITYRHSRNLALGHGLVYQPGERVHGFTSPLGTLVPALICWLSNDVSEQLALWLYRLTTIPALAAACAGMVWLGWRQGMGRPALVLLGGMLALDPKSVDFTINGMETGYLLFFLSLTLVAWERSSWLTLGIGWAGLMWSRPDGCIYIAATTLGVLAFGERRGWLFGQTLRAAALCTGLYLPWFVGAWLYYGSPVPHTVVAKAAYHSLPEYLAYWQRSLGQIMRPGGPLAVYEPAYSALGGWPAWVHYFSQGLSLFALLPGLLPRARRPARSAALAYALVICYYLGTPNHPWYFPAGAWLGYLSLAWGCDRLAGLARGPAWALVFLLLAAQLYILQGVARQARITQIEIEGKVRRAIGLWLREHARPTDKVMLESLGYIGYYSQLKMLDMPGLVSPEVVSARRLHGEFAGPIRALQPDWVVLRTVEVNLVQRQDPDLLTRDYQPVQAYDGIPALQQYGTFLGWGSPAYDSQYTIFQRRRSLPPPSGSLRE